MWYVKLTLSSSPIRVTYQTEVTYQSKGGQPGTYQTSSAVGWSVSELSASSPHLRPDSNIFSLEMDFFNPLVANLIKTGCIEFRSTNQTRPLPKTHRPNRRESDRVAILE
jgi:hypothetical protein